MAAFVPTDAHAEAGHATGDWSASYSEYLSRSTAQSLRSLRLYQEVLDCVSRGELAPTVFQDLYPAFAQAHGAESMNRLSELGSRFLNDAMQLGSLFAQRRPETFAEPEIPAPRFDAADPARWSEQIGEYAGKLNARALKAYKAELDRIASGAVTPEEAQRAAAEQLSRNMPGYLQHASRVYFDLLNGLNEIRGHYEQAYFEMLLNAARGREEDPTVSLGLRGRPGETVTTSLAITNTTSEPTSATCTVTEVRRRDGIGRAFDPKIGVTPASLALAPGEEGRLTLSLRLDESVYDPGAVYAGRLFIHGQGELPAEVSLQISVASPEGRA